LAHPILVKPCLAELSQAEPSRGNTTVKYTTIQCIHVKTIEDQFHEESTELYVTTLGDHDIILGTDWLHAHNPEVDWAVPQIAFT
jgi:hypothetical protein